jgi:hypothetical protein
VNLAIGWLVILEPARSRPNRRIDCEKILVLVAGLLAVSSVAVSHPANAAGCLRGAMVGGVAGHVVGHHGLVGAGIGCAIGHHEDTRRDRERMRDDHYDNRY